jgi:phage gp29-like protein
VGGDVISIFGQKSNGWREFYNPLRGLSLPKLVGLLEAGERGQYADLQWMYYYMERSDPMVFAILQRRRAALLDSDWDIREVSGVGCQVSGRETHREGTERTQGSADDALADEQVAFLREVYDGIGNFRDALAFLFSGFFRGYAHLEKHFGVDGGIERLEPVEQWFWVRDGMFGEWEYNENAVSGRRRGIPIERENFVIMETQALNRMLAVLYLRRNLSQKDWDSYMEVFGIPSVFLVGPPNTPEAKEKEYQAIAEEIISDGRGYLPNGSDIKYVTGGGSKAPFKEHLEYLDRQITMVGTGGLLTMLAESGSGTLAGGAHAETFRQIARGDAAVLSEVMQRDVDAPLLSEAFPGWPPLAYFEFAPAAGSDASRVVQDAAVLAGAGYRVEAGELSEKTGYALGS